MSILSLSELVVMRDPYFNNHRIMQRYDHLAASFELKEVWYMRDLEEIRIKVAEFASDRDWEKFHSPKNLAMALSVEAAELLEIFQWLTESESSTLSREQLAAVSHEIADVQVYLVRLADRVGIDILKAVEEKMSLNAGKYPVLKVHGSAKKYTQY